MQGQAGSMAGNAGKPASVEGCVVREETDYFLIPKSGNPIHLSGSGSNNPAPHEGHHVRVTGNETMASSGSGSSSPSGSNGAGTSGMATSSNPSSEPSNESSSGAMGSNEGANGSGGTGTTSGSGKDLRSAATQDMQVARIDMVSESCPSNWNTRWNNTGERANPIK